MTTAQAFIPQHPLTLISYALCPYVQRAVIMLREKQLDFVRYDIDLANKPEWFLRRSPLGKVPMLWVDQQHVVFESSVICEYIDNVSQNTMLPENPLTRAQYQGWMALGSHILNCIATLYSTPNLVVYKKACADIKTAFSSIEKQIALPYFDGDNFSMVDAVYAPIFRYFDVFESKLGLDFNSLIFSQFVNISQWRSQLRQRPSVVSAVAQDYDERLVEFVNNKKGCLVAN